MRAEKAIRALVTGAAALTALVPAARMYPHAIPQGEQLPALVIEHVSTVPFPTLDASAGFGLMQSRIQVTVLTNAYDDLKAVVEQVVLACNYQRGVLAGTRVNSVVRAFIGPDMTDDDRTVFHQSIDFLVTFQEP